jgi:hypothetical protein
VKLKLDKVMLLFSISFISTSIYKTNQWRYKFFIIVLNSHYHYDTISKYNLVIFCISLLNYIKTTITASWQLLTIEFMVSIQIITQKILLLCRVWN